MQSKDRHLTASASDAAGRLDWIDAVKGLGIILMFYGHYLQRGIDPQNSSAIDQFRLIYSFHMPMFFVAAGFFFQPSNRIMTRIRQLGLRRLVPVVFFGVLLFPLWLWGELQHPLFLWHDFVALGADYAAGKPDLDWVTWFLVCLFVCESMAAFGLRKVHGAISLLATGLACLGAGLLFCAHSHSRDDGFLYFAGSTWFLSEALVALGFYVIGHASFPYLQKLAERRSLVFFILLLSAAIVLLTFRLNHPASVAVMMAARQHGDPIDFIVTALAGTAATFMLGILLRRSHLLKLIGRNAVALLGLNGLFFHYIDPKLLHVLLPLNSEVSVALDALLVTALSLLFCAPAVYLLNRFVPQLIGKTRVSGPLLPAFEKRLFDFTDDAYGRRISHTTENVKKMY